MKAFKHFAFLILAAVGSSLPADAFQNEPAGFRGVQWGQPVEAMGAYVFFSDRKGADVYTRPGDSMMLGRAELSTVAYGFYKSRFADVTILVKKDFINEVRDALFAQFGQGSQANRYLPNYIWHGSATDIELRCSNITKECSVLMMSATLGDERRADQFNAGKNAAKDF